MVVVKRIVGHGHLYNGCGSEVPLHSSESQVDRVLKERVFIASTVFFFVLLLLLSQEHKNINVDRCPASFSVPDSVTLE